MKLHGNAALGPKGRLTVVRRVVVQDWLLAEAGEAPEGSRDRRRSFRPVARGFGGRGFAGRLQARCSPYSKALYTASTDVTAS